MPRYSQITADNDRAFNAETLAADVQLGDGFVSERNCTETYCGLRFNDGNDLVHILDGDAVAADVQVF